MSEQIEQGNGKIVFWLITISLLVGSAMLLWRFVPALLWATVLSVLLFPWYKKAKVRFKRFKHSDTVAALWVTLFTAGAIIVPFLGLTVVAGVEVYNFASDLVIESDDGQLTIENLASEADDFLVPWAQRVGIQDFTLSSYLEENKEDIAKTISGPLRTGFQKLIMTIFTLVIAFMTTFFMLTYSRSGLAASPSRRHRMALRCPRREDPVSRSFRLASWAGPRETRSCAGSRRAPACPAGTIAGRLR